MRSLTTSGHETDAPANFAVVEPDTDAGIEYERIVQAQRTLGGDSLLVLIEPHAGTERERLVG